MSLPDHNLFFASRVENGFAFLDSEESRHALSVLRLSNGDALAVTDGRGAVYDCTVQERVSETLSAEILLTKRIPRPQPSVSMFVGMCDRDRFEELAENCAALGADRIVPLVCRFCQKPWWSAWDKHSQRIRKKLVAGIKQSHNPWLPLVTEPAAFSDALSQTEPSLVLAADAGGKQVFEIVDKIKQSRAVSCFVGPPGGFSPEEFETLKKAGATLVSLSANRLRTELAAVVLCNAVKLALGERVLP
jgi:16S rRNA (uracil1498-N3)-methyltransferase